MKEKVTVLYVDDEPINLKIFELSFKNRFIIYTALSGFEGMGILKSNPEISVVVSDMRMPKMDGLEFIALAKQEFPNIIFFILTGYDITEQIADALNNRLINKYFRKPFNFKEIESSIVEALV
ncbi:MAG: response regulator [Bacteroidetes bacterium HGW-Bacteroidetes-15]|nr:MAG: response regulator [Bacteroidetes bacterium HGW-Bacteroidetes-15]